MSRVKDIHAIKKFNPSQFMPQILHASPGLKVPLICMTQGQEIPPHPGSTSIFYIIEGKGEIIVDGSVRKVERGDLVFVPDGSSRGIKALEPLAVIAAQAF